MPSYQTTGLVIGRTNFGEADRIIRLLTPQYGKLSAVARGVRKIKSRTAGHLELFGEVVLQLATGRQLDTITSARLVWYPHALTDDYGRLALAYAFGALIDRIAQEHQAQPELYEHLREALAALSDGAAGPLIELWFKLRLLQLAGYRPELQRCVACGQDNPDASYAFDAARGGIVCTACASAGSHAMPTNTIKLWRLLSDYPYTTVSQITGAATLAASSLPWCDEFYEHHLGKAIRPGFGTII